MFKMEATARALKVGLALSRRVIPAKTTIPALSTVLFKGATMKATDLDIEIETTIPATTAKGAICIEFHPLQRLVRLIDDDETIMIDADREGAALTFSGGRYELPTLPASDFPKLRTGDLVAHPVDETFGAAIRAVLPCVGTEETRYYLNGVCIDQGGMVATNGHGLAFHPVTFATNLDKAIIPAKAARIFADLKATPTRMMSGEPKRLCVCYPGLVVRTKTIDGTFPDWRRVVPSEDAAKQVIAVRNAALRDVAARMAAVGREQFKSMTIAYGGGVVVAGRVTERRQAIEYLPDCETTSAHAGEISFNTAYLASILAAMRNSATVKLHLSDAGSPARFTGDGEAFMILMPMRSESAKHLHDAIAHRVDQNKVAA